MKSGRKNLWVYAMLLAPAMAGCAAADDSAEQGDDADITAFITDLSNRVRVEEGQLTYEPGVYEKLESRGVIAKLDAFAAASDKAAVEPVFLVGNRRSDALTAEGIIKPDSPNGWGYARKALSYSRGPNGELVVKTEPAKIMEAAADITRAFPVAITTNAQSLRPLNADEEAKKTGSFQRKWKNEFKRDIDLLNIELPEIDFKTGRPTGQKIKLSQKPLFSVDGLSAQASVRATKLMINVGATFEGEIKAEGMSLVTMNKGTNSGFIRVTGGAGAEMELEGTAAGGKIEFEKEKTYHVVDLGGVESGMPASLRVDVGVKCNYVQGADGVARFGAKASGSASAEVRLENFKLSVPPATAKYSGDVTASLDAKAEFKARCVVTPKLSFHLFESLTVESTVNLRANASIEAATAASLSDQAASIEGKISADGDFAFGGGLKPFGFTIADFTTDPRPFTILSEKSKKFQIKAE